jgi:predicted AAA+ superfamily ATPase
MKTIQRPVLRCRVERALRRSRSVALLGPRQCGKTTLARNLAAGSKAVFFDLENPADLARLQDPMLALENLRGLVVLDEIQRRPDLLPVLRVLLDRRPLPARFLLLGSAAPDIIRGASETLAGRIEFIDMQGFDVREVGPRRRDLLWARGGFPPSFLAASDQDSLQWRLDFIRTFVERDVRLLGYDLSPEMLRRFLVMLAHYHGQIWNASEIGRSLQMAHPTARRYLDLLSGAFLVRQLPPWFENAGKRVVKSPKVYIRDSGLLHALLGLDSLHAVTGHPKLGASWEGFALENMLTVLNARQAYFWATQAGAELDLFYLGRGQRLGIEFKYTSAPTVTRSMHVAMADLKLDHLYVVHAGSTEFRMAEKITATSLPDLMNRLAE